MKPTSLELIVPPRWVSCSWRPGWLTPEKKVWVWFKGGLDGCEWRVGFYATDNSQHEEAVTLQHWDFKDCVAPVWRIRDKEPTDAKKAPPIPENAKWKFSG